MRRLDEHSIERATREGWSEVSIGTAYRTGPWTAWDDRALVWVGQEGVVEHLRALVAIPELRRVAFSLPELPVGELTRCLELLSTVPELDLTVLGPEQALALSALPDAAALHIMCGRSDSDEWTRILDDLLPTLSRMPGLRRLVLGGGVVDARHLTRLEHLREVDFGSVQLTHLEALRGLQIRRFTGWTLENTPALIAALAAMGTLVDLALTDCAVDDDTLPFVARATGLEVLGLASNAIQGAGLAALTDLPLRTLDLSYNPVGASLHHLARLPTLRSLNLRSVDLRGQSCTVFAGMERLVELNLGRTKVGQGVAPLIARMPSLEVLGLEGCDLSNTSFIDDLRRLRVLDLEHNRPLNGLDVADVSGLLELEDLNLRFISGIGLRLVSALAALPSLVALNLVVCSLVPDHIRALARSTSLRRLKLCGNDLGDVGVQALAPLAQLALLDLSRCRVTDVGAASLAEHHPDLRYLGLDGNRLTDAGADAVMGLGRLLWLDLCANQINGTDRTLPGAHVQIDDQKPETSISDLIPCFLTAIDEALERAFDGVPLPESPSLTLYQAAAADDYETCDRSRDHLGRWQDLPPAHIGECPSAMSYLDASGMRYYLPAFMRGYLRRALEPSIGFDNVYDSLDYHLTPGTSDDLREHSRERLALLDVDQRAAIAAWVHGTLDGPEVRAAWHRVVEHDAGGAGDWFDAYWPEGGG